MTEPVVWRLEVTARPTKEHVGPNGERVIDRMVVERIDLVAPAAPDTQLVPVLARGGFMPRSDRPSPTEAPLKPSDAGPPAATAGVKNIVWPPPAPVGLENEVSSRCLCGHEIKPGGRCAWCGGPY